MNLYYFKYIYLSDNAALIIHVYQIKIVSIKSLHRHEISKSEFQFKKEKKYLNQRGVCILFCQREGLLQKQIWGQSVTISQVHYTAHSLHQYTHWIDSIFVHLTFLFSTAYWQFDNFQVTQLWLNDQCYVLSYWSWDKQFLRI